MTSTYPPPPAPPLAHSGHGWHEVRCFVERVQRPQLRDLVVLPLGQPGVCRTQPPEHARAGHAEQHPDRRHDDACVADRDHLLTVVLASHPLQHRLHPLVKAVPALALRREHAVGLVLHHEGPVARAVLRPLQSVGLAGVHLAQVAVLLHGLEAEGRRDDLRGLDRTGERARDQHVGLHAVVSAQVVAQRSGLTTTHVRQTTAAASPGDEPVEASMRVAVTHEDQPHPLTVRVAERPPGFRLPGVGDAHVMAPTRNPLVHLARHSPAPVDGLLQIAAAVLGDTAGLATGDDNFDSWDPEHIARTLPLLNPLLSAYFRSEVRGIENVPATGPALLVGNHSGGTMIVDTLLFTFAFYDHFGPDRRFHQLAHDIAARIPGLRRFGTLVASHENAQRAFGANAPVLVYPGGDFETFRPSWHSDRVEFAGRKGFVRLALDEGVPIVPVVSIGGQETALFLTRAQRLARAIRFDRLTRVKVLPISIGPPFGVNVLDLPGRLPLPAKITTEVLPPIDLQAHFGPRPDTDAVYEHVTSVMQDALDRLSEERRLPVVG